MATPPGGFLTPTLPSPAPSSSAFSPHASSLPHPRNKPLRAGSAKEETLRRYVDNRLLHISRRYVKKFMYVGPEDGTRKGNMGDGAVESVDEASGVKSGVGNGEIVAGYTSMRDVCVDLSSLVDVLWLSGTPTLQIPYLLNVALSLNSYVPAFPPSPTPTFSLLRKLDHAFASLVQGRDIDSGITLPGFEVMGSGMSRTDMVRLRSVVESTRVQVVEVMHGEPEEEVENGRDEDMSGLESGTEGEKGWDGMEEEDDDSGIEMDVARVYHRTIEVLERVLGEGKAFDAGGDEG